MELNSKLEIFFSTLNFNIKNFNDAKKRLNIYLAKDFNVFDYICPDENAISDMIADLLDPAGSHGQGSAFLKHFLKLIENGWYFDPDKCTVTREDRAMYIGTTLRKIDITLDFDRTFGIGLENKPWAEEQDNQVKDYVKNLNKKYDNNFIFIYLSGDGSNPSSIGDEEQDELKKNHKLFIFSYEEHLKNWLENCYKECKAEKIRWFLHDFIDYIETNFSGKGASMSDDEKDLIAEYCIKNEENLRTAYNIYSSFEVIAITIFSNFIKELKRVLQKELGEDWDIDEDMTENNFAWIYNGFYISKKNWRKKYQIGIQCEGKMKNLCAGVRAGVQKVDQNSEFIKSLKGVMDNQFRSGKSTVWYDWRFQLDTPFDNWYSEEALLKLHFEKEDSVNKIKNIILKIKDISEPLIDEHVKKLNK